MSDSQSRRRIPGLGAIIAILFLVVPIVVVAWWLSRPKGDPGPPPPALADLDVVCLGRIDGLNAVANLDSGSPGKIVEIYVVEGQHVDGKQKLLKLDDELLKLRVAEAQEAVKGADIEIELAKQEQLRHPIQIANQEAAISAAGDRVASARRVYEEKKNSLKFGTVTPPELIPFEAEVKNVVQLERIEKSRLDELKLVEPVLKVRAADVKRTLAEISLKQAQKAVADCVLLAPSAGSVLRVQASVGETVAPGTLQPPIVFRPDGPLVVRAELEQEFLGRVKPGMKASVRDDVRADSPTWTGTVLRVGQVVARKRSILLDPGELNDVRTVECVVSLDGNPDGLLVGQRMRVRISRE
jgi:multidrug resistance efflux pump